MRKTDEIEIDSITKDSIVVLYGAGNYGLRIWEQNQRKKWFNIVFVVDSDNDHVNFPVEVHNPDLILDVDFDVVLVSPRRLDVQNEIIERLLGLGVERKKIVTNFDGALYAPEMLNAIDYSESVESDDIRVGMYLRYGALGDQVIFLGVYQSLERKMPGVKIDIYSTKQPFTEAVFGGLSSVGKIYGAKPSKQDWKKYDIFFELSSQVLLRNLKISRVQKYSEELCTGLLHHNEYQIRNYVDCMSNLYTECVALKRAKLKGFNKYTIFNESGFFDVIKEAVRINLDSSYEKCYTELLLSKCYITFNYGANGVTEKGKLQVKMWPSEYHEKLNTLIKKAFPSIEIIQIGSKEGMRIGGADRYILGEHLEVVKYILRYSKLHIDCEGGLVHLASQLGTKCTVMFGPTPVWYLGYENNINIRPKGCGECMGAVSDWFTCYMYDEPICMKTITPEIVFEKVKNYLEENIKI